MDPIVTILHIGDHEQPIASYGLMLSIAMLVGGTLTARAAWRAGLDVGAVIASLGFAITGGLAGSYLLFVAVEWIRTGSPFPALTSGGLVFFGAPLGGGLALFFAARAFAIPLGRLADVAIHALPAAHALGRVGCLLGGCCFGRPWDGPWAITYTNPIAPAAYPPIPRHPTPLYESALLLALALALAAWPHQRVGSGRRVLAYLAGYGTIRIVMETFRGDSVRGLVLGVVSTSQIIGAVVVLGAALALFLSRGAAQRTTASGAGP